MAEELTPYEKAMGRFMGDAEPVSYDLGFVPPEVPDTEVELGKAAINIEDIQQVVQNQIAKYLATAQTNASMTQVAINNQLYNQLQKANETTRQIQQPIETVIAMQMGKAFEMANQVAPHDSVIQTVLGTGSTQQDEQWKQAAQQAQLAMSQGAGKVLPGQDIPVPDPGFGPMPQPPGVVPQPNPQQPGCMTNKEANDWLCANKIWLNPPTYVAGGPFSIPVLKYCEANGATFFLNWVFFGDVTTGVPKPGTKGILQWAGPNGVFIFSPPANCGPQTPPPPPDQTIPPSPPPCPPCPPAPPCPPVPPCPEPKEPPCIKLCKDEEEECEETEYEVYCSDGGISYLVKKGDPPRSTGDKKVATGPGTELNLRSILKECKPKDEETPPQGGSASALTFATAEGCSGLVQAIGITPPADGKWLEHLLTMKIGGGSTDPETGDNLIDAFARWVATNALPGVTGSIDNLIEGVVRWLTATGCVSGTAFATVAGRAIAGLASRLLGRATDPIETTLEYAYNEQCPYRLPTSEEATRAFLSNSIDLERLICLIQANGHRWDTWSQIVNSARSRLNTQETLVAWKRGIATTEWADENLRQLGFLEGPETEILKMLTDQIPPMSDLITMMMRDVADEKTIDWSEADKLFADKWTGQLKQWGKEQGVPDLYAKYIWRAHFMIPSPTQLFEFWRRLRHTGFLGTVEETRKKIKDALIQQDIAPQWVDAYLQVAHQPLTRVDTRRAFEIGAITESDVYDSYIDQGYSDTNAARLTQFAKAQQIERAKRSPLIKRYATGELTFSDLELELSESGFSPEMIDVATSKAQRELRYRRRKVCLSAMKKRYLLGEYKYPELRDKIQSEGIDPSQAEEIAKGWECEKSRRGKAVPAQTLCEWYTLGVIDDVDMYTRLLNLGYEQDDAAKLTQSCRIRLGLKIQKDQQKALAEAKRRATQEARAAKAAADHLENELNKIARSNEKRRATKQRRQKLLYEAAKKYADRNLVSYADAAIGIEAAITAAIAGNLADVDTVYQTAVVAASSEECDTLNCLSRLMGDLLVTGATVPSI